MSFDSATNTIDLEGIPPPPVLWFTAILDTLFQFIKPFESWRSYIITTTTNPPSWLAYRVPPMSPYYHDLLSYSEFVLQQQQPPQHSPWWSTHNLYRFAFETSSTSLGDLTQPAAILVLCLLLWLLRFLKKQILMPRFSSLARWTAERTHGTEWVQKPENQVRIYKFGEYVFRLFFHSFISVYGLLYFYDKPWWSSDNGTVTLYKGYPSHPIEPGMAWYYLIQAAYNVDAMISLLEISFRLCFQSLTTRNDQGHMVVRMPLRITWSDTVRGDFQEMFVHHIVTNLLVFGSSFFRLTRIGSMVFLIHDLSDVPVDLSKLANFLKWKYTTLLCFITMMLAWACTRIYILIFTIYRSILQESHFVCAEGFPVVFYVMYRHFFYVLVGLLILLHIIWFHMFIRMLTTFVRKDELHDLSEHKHGEDVAKKTN